MVVFSHKNKQHGRGIIDDLLKPFTYARYPGEMHAISEAPDTFGQPLNFCGPGTRLDLRLNPDGTPKPNSIPIKVIMNHICMTFLTIMQKKIMRKNQLQKIEKYN